MANGAQGSRILELASKYTRQREATAVRENRKLDGSLIGLAHFAFVVDNLQSLIKRLEDAGFSVSNTGADEPYRKNCYFIDADGFEVEFVEYLSDLPAERNLYP